MVPGGWFELGEALFSPTSDDNSIPAFWPPKVLFSHVRRALKKLNRAVPDIGTLRKHVQDAGFVDVRTITFKLPVGTWPKTPELKEAGKLGLKAVKSGAYEAYALQLCTTVLGMSAEETKELSKKALETHFDTGRNVHVYYP